MNNSNTVGGKTLKLNDLVSLGLEVPKFKAIPSDKLKEYKSLAKEIHAALGCDSYAVRSSALIEDSEKESFAGQFKTIINVKENELPSAIQEVMEHAEKFLSGHLEKFSILVQEYIEPDIAGVTFTRDPSGGCEMLIEYHKGRGEELVSGKIKPQQLKIAWNRKIKEKPLPEIEKAIENFKSIENHYKFPQDIEWCIKDGKWYFLQVRPITTLEKKDYERSLFLDEVLPKEGNFYFAKTEISEIAPRPEERTFKLLQKIYEKGGPIEKVYKKYHIKYHALDFLKLIGGELFIDKEKELKTLLPAYTYYKDLTPRISGLRGLFTSFKNMFFINRISLDDHKILFDRLKKALEKSECNDFFEDYELIFEINLLSGIALNKLEKFLSRDKSINITTVLDEGPALFPEVTKLKINIDTKNWKGNSLDLGDESEFFGRIIDKPSKSGKIEKWWESLPEYKRKFFSKPIEEALIFSRLRELGRYLIVKQVNNLREKLPKGKPSERENYQLPSVLTNIHIERAEALKGISAGIAEGELVTVDQLGKGGKKILYTKVLSPELTKHFNLIEGIITEQGGLLSHLAIIARENKIPVITNFDPQKAKIKIGDIIRMDADSGKIKKI